MGVSNGNRCSRLELAPEMFCISSISDVIKYHIMAIDVVVSYLRLECLVDLVMLQNIIKQYIIRSEYLDI